MGRKEKKKPGGWWASQALKKPSAQRPGVGVSQRFPEAAPISKYPHFQHIEEAARSLGPLCFTRLFRSYNDTAVTRTTHPAPAGGVGHFPRRNGKGRGVSQGPTLSRPPKSLDTTKMSSWRNRSGGLVTWGMRLNPTPGSRAVLFNLRDQSPRRSGRSSSACAWVYPTAHAEPPRITQAPTD